MFREKWIPTSSVGDVDNKKARGIGRKTRYAFSGGRRARGGPSSESEQINERIELWSKEEGGALSFELWPLG